MSAVACTAGASSDPPPRQDWDDHPPVISKGRRSGIYNPSVHRDSFSAWVPSFEKAPEVRSMFKEVLTSDPKMMVLFGALNEEGLSTVINAFRPVSGVQGEDLIKQGEDGDCLYVIEQGQVDVFVRRDDAEAGKGSKAVTLGKNAVFGELALMYCCPRAATVTVSSATCSLWALDREPFRILVASHHSQQTELYKGWLSEVDILKKLNAYELSRLSDCLQTDRFGDGEEIVKQGETGDKFYILEEGACAAFMDGAQGERLVKEYSTRGEYFGEVALLKKEPRKATVRAKGKVTVLSLSQEDFEAVLGPIEDVLTARITQYRRYSNTGK